jgi:hypothetical protein
MPGARRPNARAGMSRRRRVRRPRRYEELKNGTYDARPVNLKMGPVDEKVRAGAERAFSPPTPLSVGVCLRVCVCVRACACVCASGNVYLCLCRHRLPVCGVFGGGRCGLRRHLCRLPVVCPRATEGGLAGPLAQNKERWLRDEDFVKIFGMTKEEFAAKPAFQRPMLKKKRGLGPGQFLEGK